jgi:2-amino-4-hydroxy-6-hydroxymethyldihydropteridine diphosphokinase
MARCLISFGANLGDSQAAVSQAFERLKAGLPANSRLKLSRLYRTPAVGGPSGQPPFVNAVAAIETDRSPWQIWHLIREIESQLGRVRQRRWEARKIDLDILLYNDQLIWTPQLKVPHPRMCMRRFILQPAAELAADWIDPVSHATLGQLAHRVQQRPVQLVLATDPLLATDHSQTPLKLHSLLGQVALATQARIISPSSSHRDLRSDQLADSDDRGTSFAANLSQIDLPQTDYRPGKDCQRQLAWVDWREFAGKEIHRLPTSLNSPSLLFVWRPVRDGSAWEDQCQADAIQLGLTKASQATASLKRLELAGPRYLLATNDLAWLTHELTAAFEAMDCPVEVIESS